ncbi:hypothetical protein D9611_008206 [Ephemerocybe angulata]|uniref:Protein HGH1 homolog n=1 Tax=Ephemerocybe angulata TaxID=980116 RepID=A0A8H5C064_9AGAR|nr:hypothetical protein D9611_008206 [Tulosesus angulatus]
MEAQLLELVQFLRDRNPQARQLALENLLPQTVPGAPYRNAIFFKGLGGGGLQKAKESDVIRDLKLLCRDQLSVSHDAFRALVNLSDSPLLITPLSDPAFLNFIVSYIINPQSICADLAAMLLSNLTASSPACAVLLKMKIKVILHNGSLYPVDSRCGSCGAPVPYPTGEEKEVPALPLLVEAFVQGATMGDITELSKRPRKGELNFLASVFANMSVSPTGRDFFLSPQPFELAKETSALNYPLSKIVPFTEHKDPIRRKGTASTIKNCAFNARAHKAILSRDTEMVTVKPSTTPAPGIGALPYLLLPLAGPEEFDLDDQEKLLPELQFLDPSKTREADASIRLILVESLLLLCHTRWGRDYQREHGVYEILREAHMHEKNENVQEHMERLVQLLKGDEPKIAAADDEEDIDNAGLEVQDLMGTPASSTETTKPKVDDSDEEDFMIEEI